MSLVYDQAQSLLKPQEKNVSFERVSVLVQNRTDELFFRSHNSSSQIRRAEHRTLSLNARSVVSYDRRPSRSSRIAS